MSFIPLLWQIAPMDAAASTQKVTVNPHPFDKEPTNERPPSKAMLHFMQSRGITKPELNPQPKELVVKKVWDLAAQFWVSGTDVKTRDRAIAIRIVEAFIAIKEDSKESDAVLVYAANRPKFKAALEQATDIFAEILHIMKENAANGGVKKVAH